MDIINALRENQGTERQCQNVTESVLTWRTSETEDLECTHARPATVPWMVIFAPHSTSVVLRDSVTGS